MNREGSSYPCSLSSYVSSWSCLAYLLGGNLQADMTLKKEMDP